MVTKALTCGLILAILAACSAEPSARILGGREATSGQFPHQVAVFYSKKFSCSGVILDKKNILTSYECVVDGGIGPFPAKKILVRVGSNDYNSGGLLLKVKTVSVHEDYIVYFPDIAILELVEPLEYSEAIQPIELLTEEVPNGSTVTISGWGRTNVMTYSPSDKLVYSEMSVIEKTDCLAPYTVIANNCVLWLAHNETSHGPSVGDFGDPAVYKGKLAGIGYFSKLGCVATGFTKISHYVDWILEHMV